MTPTAVAHRRARWGIALVLAVVPAAYGTGMLLTATRPAAVPLADAAASVIRVAGGLGVAFIGFALIAGFAQLVRAAASVGRMAALAASGAAVGAIAMAAAVIGPMSMFVRSSGLAGPLAIAGAAGAMLSVIASAVALYLWSAAPRPPARAPWTGEPRFTTSRARGLAGVAALAGLLLVIGLGLAEALVWGPLAQAPGYSLAGLYDGLSRGDVRYGTAFIIAWAIIWLIAAGVLLTLCLLPSRPDGGLNRLLTPRRVLLAALAIGSVATFWQGWSTFSLGMSIADTLPPYAGGHSAFWGVYTAIGQAAFVVVILRSIIPGPPTGGAADAEPAAVTSPA